jgi:hypothetical protein
MCGLHLSEIVEILSIQGDGTFTAKYALPFCTFATFTSNILTTNRDRRPQQFVRELLADGKHRFSTPDKATARKRIALLRSVVGCHGGHKPGSRNLPAASSALSGMQDHVLAAPPQPHEIITDHYALVGNTQGRGSYDTLAVNTELQTSEVYKSPPRLTNLSKNGLGISTSLDNLSTEPFLNFGKITTGVADRMANNPDETASVLSRRRRVRGVLHQRRFSSSLMSDLFSLLEKKFPLSTFTS